MSTHITEKDINEYLKNFGGIGPLSPELKAELDAVLKMIGKEEMKKK